MKQALFAALLLLPSVAWAQTAPKPEMVLIPRDVAMTALNWITQPDAMIAVKLYAALSACIQDNPSGGTMMRSGQDPCQVVTDAIAAREKEVGDLQAKIADLTAKLAAVHAAPPPKKD